MIITTYVIFSCAWVVILAASWSCHDVLVVLIIVSWATLPIFVLVAVAVGPPHFYCGRYSCGTSSCPTCCPRPGCDRHSHPCLVVVMAIILVLVLVTACCCVLVLVVVVADCESLKSHASSASGGGDCRCHCCKLVLIHHPHLVILVVAWYCCPRHLVVVVVSTLPSRLHPGCPCSLRCARPRRCHHPGSPRCPRPHLVVVNSFGRSRISLRI